ncbi:ABC transporter permease [candidate division KSB1 bacterium]
MISGNSQSPPKTAERIISLFAQYHNRPYILGDLEEDFLRKSYSKGVIYARLWYWIMCLKILPGFMKINILWSLVMFRNYLIIAVRNFKKNKLYSLINVLGLSIAFGCCILVFSFIRSEITYDRFHENAEDIFEIYARVFLTEDEIFTGTQHALGPVLTEQFPEILSAARVSSANYIVKYEDKIFTERFICTEPAFFDIFTFPLREGDAGRPVEDINSVIVNRHTAEKYFGDNEALGKTLLIQLNSEFKAFTVTGVLEDIPDNSSIKPQLIINLKNKYGENLDSWKGWSGPAVLVRLDNKDTVKDLQAKFPSTIDKHLSERGVSEKSGYILSPLLDYHFDGIWSTILIGKSKGLYSYVLAGIAALILIIAIFNFVNLSLGGSSTRSTEIGMRKVFGAQRKQLVRQFWFETVFQSFVAFVGGIIFAVIILPSFNLMAQKTLEFGYLLNWQYIFGFLMLVMFVGIAAGSYPSLVLSGFSTAELFKKVLRFSGKNSFSRVCIVFQFTISIFFIISTLIIYNQYDFLLDSKFGIDSDQVVILDLQSSSGEQGRNTIIFNELKNGLMQHSSVLGVTAANSKYDMFSGRFLKDDKDEMLLVKINWIDYDYLGFFGINFIEGRDFSRDHVSDVKNAVIVNKTFIDRFNIESPVGTKLSDLFDNIKSDEEIVGVVDDFHSSSLHENIAPAYLKISGSMGIDYIYIKMKGDDIQSTLNIIKSKFAETAPNMPFFYSFMDEEISQNYENEKRHGTMFSYLAIFALFISSSGLFGLTSLTVARRIKEIGIRKVLGASIPGIIRMINIEFMILVVIGSVLAWPLTYYMAEKWLRNFAYKINISPVPFLIASIAALIIAVITISIQSGKAALADPVKTLRNE